MQFQYALELIKLGPALFIFMELLEPLLWNYVVIDRASDRQAMRYENGRKIDEFDFIIGERDGTKRIFYSLMLLNLNLEINQDFPFSWGRVSRMSVS